MRNRIGKTVNFAVELGAIKRLKELKTIRGEDFPRFGILVVSYNASDLIVKTINRIPSELKGFIDEIFVFDDFSTDNTYEEAMSMLKSSPWRDILRVFRNPRNMGYGGNQKIGFQYAIDRGFDYVILLHGDGQYAPEFLPEMMLPVLESQETAVFGSRMMVLQDALDGGMPRYKWIGNRVLTWIENLVLGLDLSEYHTGYRLYSTEVLAKIPFIENTDGFHFDSQIVVQLRIAGVEVYETPIKTYYGDEKCHVNGIEYALNVCKSVIEYRLHQLHLIRRTYFILNEEVVYTRKRSPYSSHGQILSLVEGPGLALDLGSSTGLLTESLLEKKVESIGVDQVDSSQVEAPFKEYIESNLEHYQNLSFDREFDYIILADVLEHLRNGDELLLHVRKFLKKDGRLIISVPNIAIWFYRISLLVGRFNYGSKGILDETHVKLYTLDSAVKTLTRAGFILRRLKTTSLPFEVVFESTGRSKLLKAIDKFYYHLSRAWPRMFSYQIVLEAQIRALEADCGEGQVFP